MPSLAHVLQGSDEHALPPRWNRARRRIGSICVVRLVAHQRGIEHADDTELRVIAKDAVLVPGTHAVQRPGLECPTLAGRLVLERRAASAHVVGFPVMLVPEIVVPCLLRAR